MPSSEELVDARSAWQDQPTSGFRLLPSQMASRIAADDRKTHRATLLVSGLLIVFTALLAVAVVMEQNLLRRVGLIAIGLSMVYIVGQLAVHAARLRALRSDVNKTTGSSVAAARAYLTARLEYHSGLSLWSRVAAMLPGVPIFALGTSRVSPALDVLWRYVPYMWVAVLVLAVVGVQRPMARDYQRQLRELDQLER